MTPPPVSPTTPAPQTLEAQLWCMHIAGPDDVHPAPDFWTALAWAAELNTALAKKAAAENWAADDNYPWTQATVQRWRWSDAEHATGLAKELAERSAHDERLRATPSTIPGRLDREAVARIVYFAANDGLDYDVRENDGHWDAWKDKPETAECWKAADAILALALTQPSRPSGETVGDLKNLRPLDEAVDAAVQSLDDVEKRLGAGTDDIEIDTAKHRLSQAESVFRDAAASYVRRFLFDQKSIQATEITLGEGLVDITSIKHEGKSGVLFRPRRDHIPYGETGELQEGSYWPVAGDVVLWVSGEGPQVAIDALAALATAPATDAGPGAGVPAGWKLVPEEPSAEMHKAAADYENRCAIGNYGGCADFEGLWYAALAASPPQPGTVAGGEVDWSVIRDAVHDAVANGEGDLTERYLKIAFEKYGVSVGTELSQAATHVLAERRRQVEAKGWSPEHDDTHYDGELALAASCYAYLAHDKRKGGRPVLWPWSMEWWKPGDARRMLVKAGALILAEIERLDRAPLPTAPARGVGG